MLVAITHTPLLSFSTPMLADARVRLPENHLDPGIRPVVPFQQWEFLIMGHMPAGWSSKEDGGGSWSSDEGGN